MSGEVRWCCIYCGASGDANNDENLSLALLAIHERYACPATDTWYNHEAYVVYENGRPRIVARFPDDGFVARMERRERLAAAYGEGDTPPYGKPYKRRPEPRRNKSPESLARAGTWLVASQQTGKQVTHNDEYPHICGTTTPGDHGSRNRYSRDDCIACWHDGYVPAKYRRRR